MTRAAGVILGLMAIGPVGLFLLAKARRGHFWLWLGIFAAWEMALPFLLAAELTRRYL